MIALIDVCRLVRVCVHRIISGSHLIMQYLDWTYRNRSSPFLCSIWAWMHELLQKQTNTHTLL